MQSFDMSMDFMFKYICDLINTDAHYLRRILIVVVLYVCSYPQYMWFCKFK